MRGTVLAVAAGVVLAAGGGTMAAQHASAAEAPAPAPCTAGDLAASLTESEMYRSGPGYYENVRVTLTNTAAGSCTLEGAPAVTLTAGRDPWAVPAVGTPEHLLVAPSQAVHTTLRLRVAPEATEVWEPETLHLLLPLADEPTELSWPSGLAVERSATVVQPFTTGS